MVRGSQCSLGDGVIYTTDCRVTLIQSVLLSGRTFNKRIAFGEFVTEISHVKIAENTRHSLQRDDRGETTTN